MLCSHLLIKEAHLFSTLRSSHLPVQSFGRFPRKPFTLLPKALRSVLAQPSTFLSTTPYNHAHCALSIPLEQAFHSSSQAGIPPHPSSPNYSSNITSSVNLPWLANVRWPHQATLHHTNSPIVHTTIHTSLSPSLDWKEIETSSTFLLLHPSRDFIAHPQLAHNEGSSLSPSLSWFRTFLMQLTPNCSLYH
jgi:hypothetical protein